VILKYLFRTDAFIDFAYSNWINSDLLSQSGSGKQPLMYAIFGVSPRNTTLQQAITAKNLPLTKFFYMKGIAVTYGGLSADTLKLDFKVRPDTFHLGHLHSSQGEFFLMGAGRVWFSCMGYHRVENDLVSGPRAFEQF
jgi:hypothetical protein